MANTTGLAAPTCPTRSQAQDLDLDGQNPTSVSEDVSRHVSAGSLVGYARCSTVDQVLDRQVDALTEAGCDRVFTDHGVSGTQSSRPGLDECLNYLRAGDTLCIQALDRLGRRTGALLALCDELAARGVSLRILNLGIDTRTPAGQMVLSVMAALSQMERDILVERTRQGIAAARARGRVGGRPRVLTDSQTDLARSLRDSGKSWNEIGALLGCSERTVRRRVGGLAA